MSRLKDAAILVLALLCVGLAVSRLAAPAPLEAQDTAGGAGDLIAVTGSYATGTSVLYVIDAKSRNLAVYEARNGRKIRLVAARKIEWDLRLNQYNDESEESARVTNLQRDWQKFDETQKKAPGERAPGDTEKKNNE